MHINMFVSQNHQDPTISLDAGLCTCPLRPSAYFLVNLGFWKIRPSVYFLEKFCRIWASAYLRFSFNILVRIYTVKTLFSKKFPLRGPIDRAFIFWRFWLSENLAVRLFLFKNLLKWPLSVYWGGGLIYISLVYGKSSQILQFCVTKQIENLPKLWTS